MSTLVRRCLSTRVARWVRRGSLLLAAFAGLCSVAHAQSLQAPQAAYFLNFPAYYDGDYVATQASLLGFLGGAIKNPAAGGFWIDAICYETMRGECYYQLGNHALAYTCYDNALKLLTRFNNWMLSVQFTPVVTPANPQQLTPVPWYITQRQTVVGAYPLTMNIQQGNINNNQAVFQGGVVQPAVLMPLYCQEIVRCSCLAIRRWRELLGPACPYSETTKQLVAKLSQRAGFPNHWSEAWIDSQLGLAYAAAGNHAQARKILQRAELASGSFDHVVTCHVLLELGKLDLEAGDLQSAQKNFLEASWSAANFKDFGVIEEALRYGAVTHFMQKNEPYPPLAAATTWATAQGLTQLQGSLMLSGAENQILMDQPAPALALLTSATALTARTDMPKGKIGARLNHLRASALYQLNRVVDGDASLFAAMGFQALGSLWLYQIGVVDVLWAAKDITERTAVDLYTLLLRDPTPTDWIYDPLESLSVLTVPHHHSYENWFDASLIKKNKEHERAFEIADLARRHRFLTTVEHGGRLLNLRWVLEAPSQALDDAALLQRQAILARFPVYDEKAREAKRLRAELRKLPLAVDEEDKEVAAKQSQLLAELATVSTAQEAVLRQISVRREAGNIVFPPRRTFKQVQEGLNEGQSLLMFYTTSRFTYGFLVGKDKYSYPWEIKPTKRFLGQIAGMLQAWGNFEQNKELKLDDLTDGWVKPAQEIMNVLVKNSKTDFTKTLDELIIVPDGLFWYIPFEAMPAPGQHPEPLINRFRIRYAPTVGLAMGNPLRRRSDGNLAVVMGRLFPRDGEAVVNAGFDEISRAMPEAVAIRGKLPGMGSVYLSLFDRMIVLNEISPQSAGYDWSLFPVDTKQALSTMGQSLWLPFNGPDQVILPGFRTAAERSLKLSSKDAKDASGNDLFLATCGLMAGGARTVLISRWRTGGQTSIDLAREFVQELPHTNASDAWQRSVQLTRNSQVNIAAEPRLNITLKQLPPKADHPFFWAGYLLADTGAQPMSDGDDETVDQILAVKPADDKPANEKPADSKPNAKADDKPGDQDVKKPAADRSDAVGANDAKVQPVNPAADDANVAADSSEKPAARSKRARPATGDRKKPSDKPKRAAA